MDEIKKFAKMQPDGRTKSSFLITWVPDLESAWRNAMRWN
jgi:hypothetical protein